MDAHASALTPKVDSPPPAPHPPCVHFTNLKAFLPRELGGYAPHAEHASTGKYGEVSVSEAERTFVRSDEASGSELSVRILDTTLLTSLGPAIRAAAQDAQHLSEQDPVGPVHLPASVGFVRYEPEEQLAEVNLLVGDRYVVAVTHRGARGTHEVRDAARHLDLAGLAKLR